MNLKALMCRMRSDSSQVGMWLGFWQSALGFPEEEAVNSDTVRTETMLTPAQNVRLAVVPKMRRNRAPSLGVLG